MARDERAARLRRAIDGLAANKELPPAVDLSPRSAHEVVTRQMVTDLASDLTEVKNRVNTLIWVVVGAVAVNLVMRLAGVG